MTASDLYDARQIISCQAGTREFIALLGGAATIPLVAHAQQSERMRSIGVLLPASPNDPVFQARLAAFHQELALLGWIIGRNVRIDTRWATTNPVEIRRNATELVALAPDVILASGSATVGPLLQVTHTVPIANRSGSARPRCRPP